MYGHSLTRRLNSDGKVDSMQTLRNLNEDELANIDRGSSDFEHDFHVDSSNSDPAPNQIWGRWALPSSEQTRRARGFGTDNETNIHTSGRTKKVVKINID